MFGSHDVIHLVDQRPVELRAILTINIVRDVMDVFVSVVPLDDSTHGILEPTLLELNQ